MRPANVLTVTTLKGGTGKTTFLSNLACGLAARGKHVLMIDLDPNTSLTIAVGQQENQAKAPLAHLLTYPGTGTIDQAIVDCQLPRLSLPEDAPPREVRRADRIQSYTDEISKRLWLCPGGSSLMSTNLSLSGSADYYWRLSKMLEEMDLQVDWVIIDTPGGETAQPLINVALMASDQVMSAIEPGLLEVNQVDVTEGMIDNIDNLRPGNPLLRWGYVMTRVEPHTNIAKDMQEFLVEDGVQVLPWVPKAAGFKHQISHGVPLILQEPEAEAVRPINLIVDSMIRNSTAQKLEIQEAA